MDKEQARKANERERAEARSYGCYSLDEIMGCMGKGVYTLGELQDLTKKAGVKLEGRKEDSLDPRVELRSQVCGLLRNELVIAATAGEYYLIDRDSKEVIAVFEDQETLCSNILKQVANYVEDNFL